MKTILAVLIALAFAATAPAQSPAPSPLPVANQPIVLASPQTTTAQQAQIIAGQVNYTARAVKTALANGIPARNGQPAVSAADLQAALGAANVAKLNAMLSALGAQ